MFEKEVGKEKAVIGVNANQVIKVEPGTPSRGGQTTRISYSKARVTSSSAPCKEPLNGSMTMPT